MLVVSSSKKSLPLSDEGRAFLCNKELFRGLKKIAKRVGVSPEEYLRRFEEVLRESPELIFNIFEK